MTAPERIWLIKDPHTPSPWVSERGEVWANDPICLGEYIRADLLDAAVNEALERAAVKANQCWRDGYDAAPHIRAMKTETGK